MIILKTVDGNRIALHKEDILNLVEGKGTINGNRNKEYVLVNLRNPVNGGYNVLDSLDEILKILQLN